MISLLNKRRHTIYKLCTFSETTNITILIDQYFENLVYIFKAISANIIFNLTEVYTIS